MTTKTDNTAKKAEQDTTVKAYETKEVKAVVAEDTTKSARIRKLHAMGLSTGDIARAMGISYQHARNVLKMPLANKS